MGLRSISSHLVGTRFIDLYLHHLILRRSCYVLASLLIGFGIRCLLIIRANDLPAPGNALLVIYILLHLSLYMIHVCACGLHLKVVDGVISL